MTRTWRSEQRHRRGLVDEVLLNFLGRPCYFQVVAAEGVARAAAVFASGPLLA